MRIPRPKYWKSNKNMAAVEKEVITFDPIFFFISFSYSLLGFGLVKHFLVFVRGRCLLGLRLLFGDPGNDEI